MSGMSSRIWSRMVSFGRDGVGIGRAFGREIRQNNGLADAFRNTLVAQARQSNHIATSMLSLQQQIGLLRYHGLQEYWRHHRPALLTTTATTSAPTPPSTTPNYNNNNVAQVAFMITASMRQDLTQNLGYTAEQVKSLTPVEASLILHHKVAPVDKDEQLPGILAAHQEQQEKIQQEQVEQARVEEERQQQQAQLEQEKQEQAHQQQEGYKLDVPSSAVASLSADKQELLPSSQQSTTTTTTPDSSGFQLDYSGGTTSQQQSTTTTSTTEEPPPPLGSFVKSMVEQVDNTKDWYRIMETRASDNSVVSVGLFANLKEAEMALDLKQMFAQRRAKEDKDNLDNTPLTTYTIEKTRL